MKSVLERMANGMKRTLVETIARARAAAERARGSKTCDLCGRPFDVCGTGDKVVDGQTAILSRLECLEKARVRLSNENATLRRKIRGLGRLDAKRLRQVYRALGYVEHEGQMYWPYNGEDYFARASRVGWTLALAEVTSVVAQRKRTERYSRRVRTNLEDAIRSMTTQIVALQKKLEQANSRILEGTSSLTPAERQAVAERRAAQAASEEEDEKKGEQDR